MACFIYIYIYRILIIKRGIILIWCWVIGCLVWCWVVWFGVGLFVGGRMVVCGGGGEGGWELKIVFIFFEIEL